MIKRTNILITLFLFCLLPIGLTGKAANDVQASLSLSTTSKELNVQVEIKGHQLDDLYAYQFNLAYDPEQVRFIEATSPIHGFLVSPIVEDDNILFAHTKVGKTEGTKGEATLATFTFKRIANGDAQFKLYHTKLVDSDLDHTELDIDIHGFMTPLQTGLKDIKGHWAELSIILAENLGWVTGYEDQSFRPQSSITRAEFTAMLVRAMDLPVSDQELDFTDLQDIPTWSRPYISAAAKANLIQGYTDGSFRANNLISRAEMATMIVRASGIEVKSEAKPSFSDTDSIPLWAQPSVAAAVEEGWIQGRGNNLFAPLAQSTRAEAVTLIVSILSEE